jgi:hypothetical protein
MTDRDLLELAAKAAGIEIKHWIGSEPFSPHWNPLTDDGDALRLAVKLGINILPDQTPIYIEDAKYSEASYTTFDVKTGARLFIEAKEDHDMDRGNATRRAIVRAAAEIGRAKELE